MNQYFNYPGIMNNVYQPFVRAWQCYCPPVYNRNTMRVRQQPGVNYSVADWLEDERKNRNNPNWQPDTGNGTLSLSNKGLTSLEGLNQIQGLGNLQSLFLKNNNLTEIYAGDFQGLGNLRYLLLSNNELKELPAEIFQGLDNLEFLFLNGNKLKELPNGIFQGLANLRNLVLSNNELKELPAEIFQGLVNLKSLSLSNNKLSSYGLPLNVFQDLLNLEFLYISNNYFPPKSDDRGFKVTYNLRDNVNVKYDPQIDLGLPPKGMT